MMPALQINASSFTPSARTVVMAALTVARSARSQATGTGAFGIVRMALLAFSVVRASPMIRAPRIESTRAVSWPMPEPTPEEAAAFRREQEGG